MILLLRLLTDADTSPLFRAGAGCAVGEALAAIMRLLLVPAAPEPAGWSQLGSVSGGLERVAWPPWIATSPIEIRGLYAFHITNHELMGCIPCFCGCGRAEGHRSVYDCFIRRIDRDGTIRLDSAAPT